MQNSARQRRGVQILLGLVSHGSELVFPLKREVRRFGIWESSLVTPLRRVSVGCYGGVAWAERAMHPRASSGELGVDLS